jgi:agmatinase
LVYLLQKKKPGLVILPIPWEVTVSYNAGTARAPEHIFNASLQVDLFDPDMRDAWKQGFFMRPTDKKVLMKSDYLRKEAELYINYIAQGDRVEDNKFMCKTLKEINAGSNFLNNWVYEQTKDYLMQGKLVACLAATIAHLWAFLKPLQKSMAILAFCK